MVYRRFKRRRFTRSRFVKRRRYGGFKSYRRRVGFKLQKYAGMYHRKKIIPEYKRSGIAVASTGITVAGGLLYCLNVLSQGDGSTNRDGNKVQFKNLSIRYSIIPHDQNPHPCYVRVIMFCTKDTEGVNPANTDILTSTTSALCINAHRLLLESNNIFVFYDKVHNVRATTGAMSVYNGATVDNDEPVSLAASRGVFKRYFKRLNLITNYSLGNAGTVADISSGGLHIMVITDATSNPPNFSAEVRLRFIDT